MLTMLVVDDEIYALKGITQGIDWSDTPFGSILEADNVKSAMKTMEQRTVDLVISDIEMPGANGMELLRWIHERFPGTLVIFLTGHARFDYAREALQLGCFDYALKPIDHELLKETVVRAVKEIQSRKEMRAFEETLDIYRRQWISQLPILVERFWQDLLGGRVSMDPGRLDRQFDQYGIPLRAGDFVLPVLLSIEEWNVEMNGRDENIMEYAVRKAAAEMIVGELPGTVLQDRGELNLVILYLPDGEPVDRDALLARCRQYVAACQDYFHCRISCYVGKPASVVELPAAIDRLVQSERSNMSALESVIDAAASPDAEMPGGSGIQAAMPFSDWSLLLDGGRQDELLRQLDATVRRLEAEKPSRETLEMLYYGFLHMLFQTAHRKGLSIYEALTVAELNDPQASRSPQQLLHWAARLVDKTSAAFNDRKDTSAVIAKISAYVQENLHRDLTRDDIAGAVYRNPAYLSRLFRKETGMSLSEYIAQQRIERAKKLLVDTNDKISHIAEGLGYVHFSYFAKLFRKMTGLTPQEYRKRHQAI